MEIRTLLIILGMALVTYLTRAGGLWATRILKPSSVLESWFRHLPGAVIVSIVAPAICNGGMNEIIAAATTAFVAGTTKNLLLAIATGTTLLCLLRM